jgi:hypothetical protein
VETRREIAVSYLPDGGSFAWRLEVAVSGRLNCPMGGSKRERPSLLLYPCVGRVLLEGLTTFGA